MAGAASPGEAPLLLRPRPEALGGLADLPGAAAATGAEWPLGSLGSLGGGSPPPAFCGQKPWLALRQANAAGRGAGPALREAGLSAGQARAACRLLAALAPGRGAAGGGGAGGEVEFGACWAIVLLALQTARWPRQRRELAAKASVGLPSAPGEGWPTADPAGEHLHYPYGPGEREDEGLAHQGPLSPRRRHQNPEAGAGGGAEDALAAFLREQLEGLLYMVASATLSLPGATASIRAEEVDALGLLFHAPGPVHGGKQLSEVIPFFAGGREAAPLPAVQQWLLKQLDGPPPEVLTIDRVVRTTAVQRSAVLHRNSVVSNCHDAIVYCMVPASFVLVSGCSDCIILAGAVGQCVRVEYCERVQILAAARCVCVSNCHDSLFNLGVGTRPLLLGDNRNLQLAPYNTYYDQLEAHMEVRPRARGLSRNHRHGARTDALTPATPRSGAVGRPGR